MSGGLTPPAFLNRQPLARYETAPPPPGLGAGRGLVALCGIFSRLVGPPGPRGATPY